MRLWKIFVAWLYRPIRRQRREANPELHSLDVPQLRVELEVEESARKTALAGQPSPDATELSGPEQRIIARLERSRRDYMAWAAKRLAILNKDLATHEIPANINRANAAEKQFETRASALVADREADLRALAAEAERAQRALEAFRQAHGLDGPALNLSAARTFLAYAVLALFVVVEGLANAFFFSQGIDTGLIGGFVYAALFAAINVGVAFSLGKAVIRNVFHRSLARKLWGWTGVVIALVSMVAIGLVIAHFRDSLMVAAPDPTRDALMSLVSSPFGLRDVLSFLLLAISVGFALAAMLDGLFSGERYPGYGKVSREAEAAVEEYESELSELRDELQGLKDKTIAALVEEYKTAHASLQRLGSIVQTKKALKLRLETAMDNAERCMVALIHEFRTINQEHRDGLPAPAYFNMPVRLSRIERPEFDIEQDAAKLEELGRDVEKLIGSIEGIRTSIEASLTRQIDRLTPLDEQFASPRVAYVG